MQEQGRQVSETIMSEMNNYESLGERRNKNTVYTGNFIVYKKVNNKRLVYQKDGMSCTVLSICLKDRKHVLKERTVRFTGPM